MKNYRDFEKQLLNSSENLKAGFSKILKNLGQAVAAVTAAVAVIITFTEVAFPTLDINSLAPSALALLLCSYIIYFSLEDAGEKLAEESEEYKSARLRFKNAAEKISGENITEFRAYLENYAKEELNFRRRGMLTSQGISYEEFQNYLSLSNQERSKIPKEKRRALDAVAKEKLVKITPRDILSEERTKRGSELENPEKKKLAGLILKLLPSTLCMLITVSVVLDVRTDMTLSDILNGVIKLAALPMIGFRGYSQGYLYGKNSLSAWLSTKAEIIEGFSDFASENNYPKEDMKN